MHGNKVLSFLLEGGETASTRSKDCPPFAKESEGMGVEWVTLQRPSMVLSVCVQQAIYERLFCWIVTHINDVIEVKNYDTTVHGKNTVIGVLDIYGFEIFDNNR